MPEGMLYCKITGRLRAFGGDTDETGIPLFTAVKGKGTITCSAPALNLIGAPETIFPTRIPFTIDAEGYISKGSQRFIMILAPSPVLDPPAFTYRIRLNFDDGRIFGPFSFAALPGGVVDMADVIRAGTGSA